MPLSRIPLRSAAAARTLLLGRRFSVTGDSRPQKLERIAGELLDLSALEMYDYSILFRLKLGLDRFGPAASASPAVAAAGQSAEGAPAAAAAAEKTAFDIKLERFDAAAKIKVIKEVRTFTDLGLKEAKEMVEKAPVVLKKGVTKEEAESIIAKLNEIGAVAVLE